MAYSDSVQRNVEFLGARSREIGPKHCSPDEVKRNEALAF